MEQQLVSKQLEKVAGIEARDELTDFVTYSRLSKIGKNAKTKLTFSELSKMELRHYEFWKRYSAKETIKPNRFKIVFVIFLRWIMGVSFAIKYLEGQEASTIKKYEELRVLIPAEDKKTFEEVIIDEKGHENSFAEQVQGSYVKYISFIVLGLADALVEIAGIHAGSLGIYKSTELTGLAGIIAGAAASLAMASAAFAQAKQGFQGNARLAAAYTGVSYFISAVILATPYFLTKNMLEAITTSVVFGTIIIASVSWYNSVMSSAHFTKDFLELAGIMLGATFALFIFGTVIRILLGITV
jgi:vacuolar iron transporter family protein